MSGWKRLPFAELTPSGRPGGTVKGSDRLELTPRTWESLLWGVGLPKDARATRDAGGR